MEPENGVDTPFIVCRDVDVEDAFESEYKVRLGNRIKYLRVAPATLDDNGRTFPLAALPQVPLNSDNWTVVNISRDPETGQIRTTYSNEKLEGVRNIWHATQINILDLERVKYLTSSTCEATFSKDSGYGINSPHSTYGSQNQRIVIAKIAHFEWEVSRIEKETRAYQLLHELQATHLAPRFLGHIHENGRVIGFLIERLENYKPASIADLAACKSILRRFHALGFLHGDVNRNNFMLSSCDRESDVKLIDFECFQEKPELVEMEKELEKLPDELVDDSGRGAGPCPISADSDLL